MTIDDWKDIIGRRGCVLCRHLHLNSPSVVHLHHAREGQGLAQRADDALVIPLCQEHHQGSSGWHGLGKRGFYTRYRLDELDLLAMAIRQGLASIT